MKITDQKHRLVQLGLDADILNHYHESHRFYHTLEHLDDLCGQLELKDFGDNAPYYSLQYFMI